LQVVLAIASLAISANASGQATKKTPRPVDVSSPKKTPSPEQVDVSSPKKTPSPEQVDVSSPKKTPSPEQADVSSPKKTPSPEQADVSSPKTTPSPMPVDVSSLKPDDLRSFDTNPPEVQKLLTAALELTERKLGYLYGSADPERGGMDCSGTIYFLLQKAGMTDAPRSASLQYVWVRKADTFHAVVSNRADSFELDDLRPGDLLFWTGTYTVSTDPPVTHSMIYLGKARSDGRPLMVGASDGRTYRGDKKFGVSVFDFVLPKPNGKNPASRFIGYAKIPP
jgi:peptidoglycan DL-endopeptidase CwlO